MKPWKPDIDRKMVFKSVREYPPMAVSLYTMMFNKTGTWRTVRPVINYEKCVYCLMCWKFCPEPAIYLEPIEVKGKERMKPIIDYDYCKGCMICAEECPVKAIEGVEEER
ncbi:2-ketoisovalerate ferredoxin oxidoreductase [bacterium]|nr:MAG: 2-ketoisovalerate ferredoxin oxidoreductase [bacterium]